MERHPGMVCFTAIVFRNKIMLHFTTIGVFRVDEMLENHVCISIQKNLCDFTLLTGVVLREWFGKGLLFF